MTTDVDPDAPHAAERCNVAPDVEASSGEIALNASAHPNLAGLTAADAEWFEGIAVVKRASAELSLPVFAAQANAEAGALEALATSLRDPAARGLPRLQQGQGGETASPEDCDDPWHLRELDQVVAAKPAVLAADASLDRLRLARDAGVLNTAVELASDVGAANGGERMLSHQLAAAHQLAMGLFTVAGRDLHRHKVAPSLNPGALLDAQRSAAVGARVMSSYAQGLVALDRLRNGNRQVVQVQHVTVNDGGQALVAGTVAPGESSTVPAVSHRGGRKK